MRDGVRRVTEVAEVVGMEEETISLGSLFAYRFVGESPDGSLKGVFEATGTRPRFLNRLEYFGLGAAFLAAINPHPPDAT